MNKNQRDLLDATLVLLLISSIICMCIGSLFNQPVMWMVGLVFGIGDVLLATHGRKLTFWGVSWVATATLTYASAVHLPIPVFSIAIGVCAFISGILFFKNL